MLLTALCAVTYSVVELPWRYSVVEPDILQDHSLVDGLVHWKKSKSGVTANAEEQQLCLESAAPGIIPFLIRNIPLSAEFEFLRIGAESKADSLAPGDQPWQQGHLFVRNFDDEGTWLWYWPSKLAVLAENRSWADDWLTIPVQDTVKSMRLVAYNGGHAGEICFRNLRVEGLRERSIFTFMRYGIFVAWGTLSLWVACAVWKTRGSAGLKTLFLGLGLATVAMVALPQPHYGKLINPFQESLSSIVVSSEAENSQQAGADASSTTRGLSGDDVHSEPETESALRKEVPEWILKRVSLEDIFHAASFFLLAFFACVAYRHVSLPVLLIVLCAAPLASESFQFLLVTRSSEWGDLLADGVGLFMGISAAGLFRLGFGLRPRKFESGLPVI